mmetsp:Transcript_39173/g.92188  ORF Transcript_39173/g.92188 Transcript_39173/m.92188 type:complete len:722 (+) Transcript_39173:68-2233(+)
MKHAGAGWQGAFGIALLLSSAVVPAIGLKAVERRTSDSLSPVTRIVELLTKLSKQVEEEGKKEEDLYERFVCWGTSIINAKEASNAAAATRVQSLKAYLEDLNAGRVTLTSEESDLDGEIAELTADIESAKQLRAQEKAEFETAEEEMTTAIAALEKAISVLEEATGGSASSAMLLSEKSQVDLGSAAKLGESALLSKAVELGSRFLSKGDALFLRRILMGEVPAPSFRPPSTANFKMKYEARSGGIQSTLNELLETFTTNLAEARTKEKQAAAEFETLMKAKKDQLESSQDARMKLAKEMGARGLSKEETQEEIDSLEEQIKNDEKFLEQTRNDVAKKKAEWKERQVVRREELAAIAKAISILHSDDSRDLFKKSFASQGYALLEVSETLAGAQRRHAASMLEQLASSVKDSRLLSLARQARTAGGNFTEVLGAIDGMLSVLQEQQDKDLKIKEQCESDRAADGRSAALLSRGVDELSEKVSSMLTQIKHIEEENATTAADLEQTKEEMAEAKKLRKDEHEAWAATDADDAAAADVVEKAYAVLEKFYSENQAAMLQASARQAPTVDIAAAPGAAPPPPPTTWETPYAGKQDESEGVLAILELVKADIEKDRKKAKGEEAEAKLQFEKAMDGFKEEITTLTDAITAFTARVAELEEDIGEARSTSATKKDELDAVLLKMKEAEPNCKFFTLNFEVRGKNRMLEMQGLQQAKTILMQAQAR